MKTPVLAMLGAGLLTTAQAQLLNPDSVNGALTGALAGGLIGEGINHQGWEGAAIGAASGFVLGNIAYTTRPEQPTFYTGPYASTAYTGEPIPDDSYRDPYSYASPQPMATDLYYPAPAYVRPRPNYALSGMTLGALTGGIIGDSQNHQGWEGAAIGAGVGLALGSLAELASRRAEQKAPPPVMAVRRVPAPPPPDNSATAPATSPAQDQTKRAAKPKPFNPMGAANSLFGR